MGKRAIDKYMKRVRRDMEDVMDDAGHAYESMRGHVGRRAEKAWARRGDVADDIMSYSECAADAMRKRFHSDPMGTIAVGAVLVWFLGRMVRR